MDKSNKKTEAVSKKRDILIQHSVTARAMRKQFVMDALKNGDTARAEFFMAKPLNYFIVKYIYTPQGEKKEFKTFREWKAEGASVRKGEKAFLIWGQPRKGFKNGEETEQAANAPKEPQTEAEKLARQYEFFPLCYLFSEDQVYTRDPEETETEPEPVQEQQTPTLQLDDFFK